MVLAPKQEQPRVRGWLLAATKDVKKVGLVPGNYVKIVGKRMAEAQTPASAPVPDIVNSVDNMEEYF